MAYLGVDQSLNATGLCRLDSDACVTVLATVDPGKLRDGARLAFIKRAVSSTLADVKFVALEGYSYDSVGRVFELGEVGGVLKVVFVEASIPYVVVPPVLLKKFATGSTSASKEAMILAAKNKGLIAADDNQADAFFLAQIARAFVLNNARLRCEMEVLHTLRHPVIKKKVRQQPRRLIKAAI